ncbi:transporter substrate-binding domain-containing protein [Glutamicibacter uratoxydans]|uniref:transporter substrate-binding domain-containing protein n=1 Tax=Glutamicibacter uratoxydans TaxID=43667 RepID=UPI003D6FC271
MTRTKGGLQRKIKTTKDYVMKKSMLVPLIATTAAMTLAVAACGSAGEASAPSDEATKASVESVDETSRELLPAEIRDSGELRIAASFRTPPLTMLTDDGETRDGLSYEMANLGAKRLGLEPVWSNIIYPGQSPAIAADKVDIVWETTSVDEERIKAATFVHFANANTSVLVQKGNPSGISSMQDMCGLSIGMSRGAVFVGMVKEQSEKCVADGLEPIEQLTYDGAPSGRTALQSENIDGYMSAQPDTTYFANTTGGGEVFSAVDLPEIPPVKLAIQLKKGDQVLAESLESLVNNMIEDGSYAEILKKWQMPEAMMIDKAEIIG